MEMANFPISRARLDRLVNTLSLQFRIGPTRDEGIDYSLKRLLIRHTVQDFADPILVAAAYVDCRQRTMMYANTGRSEYRSMPLIDVQILARRFADEILPWVMSQLPPSGRGFGLARLDRARARRQIMRCYELGFLTPLTAEEEASTHRKRP
jgi:hypothetical protein